MVELWNKRMHVYHGNYEKYVAQKEERRTQLMSAYKNQRDRIEQLEAFINRFRCQATKAKQVQSRIKELEKIERIEVRRTRNDHPLHAFRSPSRAGAYGRRVLTESAQELRREAGARAT